MGQVKLGLKNKDQVEVVAGKDKGSVGKVLRVLTERQMAVVEKVNMVKRHMRPDAKKQQGGIVEKEAPIHVSNLRLVCPKCAKTVRTGTKAMEDGIRVRVCKKCGESVELRA